MLTYIVLIYPDLLDDSSRLCHSWMKFWIIEALGFPEDETRLVFRNLLECGQVDARSRDDAAVVACDCDRKGDFAIDYVLVADSDFMATCLLKPGKYTRGPLHLV